MKFKGALIKERGVTFGIAIVKPHVLNSTERDEIQGEFADFFAAPTVLMAQNSRGIPQFYGRTDLVRFLSRISIARIPWREYTVS